MKKTAVSIILLCSLLLSGCSNFGSRFADWLAQDSGEGDMIVEEETRTPLENDSEVGAPAVDTGESIPEDISGTWTVSEGLPPELTSFTLVINPDQSVEQTSVDVDGYPTTVTGKIISTDSGYAIVNETGTALLTLTYEDGKLKTEALTTTPTILMKTQ